MWKPYCLITNMDYNYKLKANIAVDLESTFVKIRRGLGTITTIRNRHYYYLISFQSNFPAWSRSSELSLPNSQSYSPFSPCAYSLYQTKVESLGDLWQLLHRWRGRHCVSFWIQLSMDPHLLLASLTRARFGRVLDFMVGHQSPTRDAFHPSCDLNSMLHLSHALRLDAHSMKTVIFGEI